MDLILNVVYAGTAIVQTLVNVFYAVLPFLPI